LPVFGSIGVLPCASRIVPVVGDTDMAPLLEPDCAMTSAGSMVAASVAQRSV
jgi:hypothetical protein